MLAEARAGLHVVRLVAGDPFADDDAVKEALAVAKTVVPFDVVPGVPLGVGTRGLRRRAGRRGAHRGRRCATSHSADFDALAHAPGHARADRRRRRRARRSASSSSPTASSPTPPVTVSCDGTTTGQQTVVGHARRARARRRRHGRHASCVTVGKAAAQRDKLALVGVAPAVRLEGAGAAHQGAGRRDERAAARATARCRSRCRPSPSSRRARRPRWSARSRAWSPAATSGSCSPRPTRCGRCGRSSRSSAWTRARSPASRSPASARRRPTRCARSASSPSCVPSERAVVRGPARRLPAVRRGARPDRPGAAAARRHRHRDARGRPARARLGDRRRHGVPDGAGGAAGGRDPRRDQVRRVPGGVLHLVLDRAQPRRHRRQAARADRRGLHRPADRGHRARVRPARRRPAGDGDRARRWSTRSPSSRSPARPRRRRRPRRPRRRRPARVGAAPPAAARTDRSTCGRSLSARSRDAERWDGDERLPDLPPFPTYAAAAAAPHARRCAGWSATSRVRPCDLVLPMFVREGIDRADADRVDARRRAALAGLAGQGRGRGGRGRRRRADDLRRARWRRTPAARAPTTRTACSTSRCAALRAELGDATVLMSDLCLDEFTDHGHCGVLDEHGAVDNDATLDALRRDGAGAGRGRRPPARHQRDDGRPGRRRAPGARRRRLTSTPASSPTRRSTRPASTARSARR